MDTEIQAIDENTSSGTSTHTLTFNHDSNFGTSYAFDRSSGPGSYGERVSRASFKHTAGIEVTTTNDLWSNETRDVWSQIDAEDWTRELDLHASDSTTEITDTRSGTLTEC